MEVIMEQKHPDFRRTISSNEEEKAWASFYRNTRDQELAAELIAHMDKDAESRMQHSGLYLRCKQSIRLHRAREARAARIANAIRTVSRVTMLIPARAFMFVLRTASAVARFGSDIALHVCEPAASVVRQTKTRGAKRRSPAGKAHAAPNLAVAEADLAAARDNEAKSA
jgi:hypothetical protein